MPICRKGVGHALWCVAALYCLALTYLVLAPSPWWIFGGTGMAVEESVDRALEDWVQHGAAYAVLAVLIVMAASSPGRSSVLFWISLAALHGAGTEWLQSFIPRRTGSWDDLAANLVGVLIGAFAASLLVRCIRFRSRPVGTAC